MAKYEIVTSGNFDQLLNSLHSGIISGSSSASYESGSDFFINEVRLATRVYERYSWFGGNRVSMTVSILGYQNQLFVSVITAGGSKALFFKVNTLGEEAFLHKAVQILQDYPCLYQGGAKLLDNFTPYIPQ